MKIKFVFLDTDKIIEFDEISQIRENVPDSNINFCNYIKALTYNQKFIDLISQYRKENKFPESGFPFETSRYQLFPIHKYDYLKEQKKAEDYFKRTRKVFGTQYSDILGDAIGTVFPYIGLFNRVPVLQDENITSDYYIDATKEDDYDYIAETLNLEKHIEIHKDEITEDFVKEYENEILKYPLSESYGNVEISFTIHNKVSRNQFIKYVESHWDDYTGIIEKMSTHNSNAPWSKFEIKDEYWQIIEYRNQNLTYTQIADKFPDVNWTYSDVKEFYHSTIKKINSLLT